ncbi:MAG: pilus assembly protein, partial [Rhizobiaceae bacterium]|nr:pilus assembly protein [Rhizobiaceae bacterium]
MLRRFWGDRKGHYAMLTAIVMLPLMGGLAVGIDYAEMTRQRALTLNALDAASIGTARRYLEGNITDAQLKTYAEQFFAANYGGLDANGVVLTLVLPNDDKGGGTLKLSAAMKYSPYFLPVLTALLGGNSVTKVDFSESSEVRLKNTLEVALVLDNSGSMSEKGGSSGTVRMDLLKTAAKQLVDTLAAQG